MRTGEPFKSVSLAIIIFRLIPVEHEMKEKTHSVWLAGIFCQDMMLCRSGVSHPASEKRNLDLCQHAPSNLELLVERLLESTVIHKSDVDWWRQAKLRRIVVSPHGQGKQRLLAWLLLGTLSHVFTSMVEPASSIYPFFRSAP